MRSPFHLVCHASLSKIKHAVVHGVDAIQHNLEIGRISDDSIAADMGITQHRTCRRTQLDAGKAEAGEVDLVHRLVEIGDGVECRGGGIIQAGEYKSISAGTAGQRIGADILLMKTA